MDKTKNYKHLFFDLDDTLAPSRLPMEEEMRITLETIPFDIVIVTGAELKTLESQIVGDLNCIKLSQSGNHAVQGKNKLWSSKLSDEQKLEILSHIERLDGIRNWDVSDEADLVEDRGCQISYSPIGHHEDSDIKKIV